MKNIIVFVCSVLLCFTQLGCSTVDKKKESKTFEPKLSSVSDNPVNFEQAARERDELLHELDKIFASMTGDQFQLTEDKFLNKLRLDYEALRRGIARLYAERTEHGLTFQQDMDLFLDAIVDHIEYLKVIHKKLEYLPTLPEKEQPQTQPTE